jgi:hypothetical protein
MGHDQQIERTLDLFVFIPACFGSRYWQQPIRPFFKAERIFNVKVAYGG